MTPLPSPELRSATERRPAVIYVMGAGRSGSTILGVALGNCANVLYAGELEAWLRRSGIPNFDGAARAEFWDDVRQRVGHEDLYGEECWRRLEYSLALPRIGGWRERRRLRSRYRQTNESLYRAIASSAHVTHIVDTSHYPLRAHELRALSGVDLYLVYLTRNPLSVVASFKRRGLTNPPKSLLAANAYLCLTHLLAVVVFLRHRADRRLLLRYEDFMREPEPMLRRILEWVGVSTSLPDLSSLATGIPFQGNRLLDSEVIALHPGAESVPPSSPGSYVTRLLQLPWQVIVSRLEPKASVSDVR